MDLSQWQLATTSRARGRPVIHLVSLELSKAQWAFRRLPARAQRCINDGRRCFLDVPISFSVSMVMPRKSSLASFVLACLRNPLCLSITRYLPVVCRASSSGFDVWFSASGLNVLYDVRCVFFFVVPRPPDPFDYPQHRQVHN